MKTQTGRLANPRKKAKRKATKAKRRVVRASTAPCDQNPVTRPARRRRRSNPGIVPRVMRASNPTRRRRRKGASSGGGFLLTGKGTVAKRRPNPSGGMVVAGVHIGETAMMVISGGAAAFAGAIATRFVDDKIRNKWPRIGIKLGAAFLAGLVGMKASESEAMGGMVVLPITIGFTAPMIASAVGDIFGVDAATGRSAKAKTAAETAADTEDDELDDDMEGLDPDDELDDDIDALADDDDDDDDMQGWMPQRALQNEMSGMRASVRTSPASKIPMVSPNFMQGFGMGAMGFKGD